MCCCPVGQHHTRAPPRAEGPGSAGRLPRVTSRMSDADGRERQLEAENAALRAQLAAAGLTTGRGSGLDRFALDQSAPPDNPFLRPRDYPSSRFAALLPQLGYAGEGQPGLLLEHPLPTDPAYDAARRAD